jgi:glycosyltransferase involved in cell wall biosynthesis
MTDFLRISVITPSYNQGNFIRDTIESILSQNYKNFEHIIVDGGSTDGTIEILKEYSHLKWISEKDNGAAAAINKGLKIANGGIIAWLNSDDYYDSGVFDTVNKIFSGNKELDFISGNLTYVNENKNILFEDKTYNYGFDYLINCSADVIRQPAIFFTKRILLKTGFLNDKLKLVFDYELFVRMLKMTNPYFVNKNFAFYRDYGNTLTRRNLRKQALEIYMVSRRYGGRIFTNLNKQNVKKLIYPGSFKIITEKN